MNPRILMVLRLNRRTIRILGFAEESLSGPERLQWKKWLKHPAVPTVKLEDRKVTLPECLKEFEDVFDARRAETLQPRRPGVDLKIELLQDGPVPDSRLFQLSEPELRALETYINVMLKKSFIRHSTAQSGAGVDAKTKTVVFDFASTIAF